MATTAKTPTISMMVRPLVLWDGGATHFIERNQKSVRYSEPYFFGRYFNQNHNIFKTFNECCIVNSSGHSPQVEHTSSWEAAQPLFPRRIPEYLPEAAA